MASSASNSSSRATLTLSQAFAKPTVEKWFYAKLGEGSLSSSDNFQASHEDVFESLGINGVAVKSCVKECIDHILHNPEVPVVAKPSSGPELAHTHLDVSSKISALKSSLKKVLTSLETKPFDLALAKSAIFKGTIAQDWVKSEKERSDFQTSLLYAKLMAFDLAREAAGEVIFGTAAAEPQPQTEAANVNQNNEQALGDHVGNGDQHSDTQSRHSASEADESEGFRVAGGSGSSD
ncbi:hypothetical protein BCR33DRAFT_745070 [Rhizoclosmatium globosum]|uniref:Uncharacterized protein n=1 Tax=Rhizoclosmatium globosum TaxID=329046 RepID=A0A1Y2B4V8_9FUNG|nr:hypothetical protein BCR33DRAFT_745070 [Rhizoclosmatium globosum]|eukprot:ORY29868.1 hypothetical protein BCR33DRAFT_745070 [Rhizoclosmatium globosum]